MTDNGRFTVGRVCCLSGFARVRGLTHLRKMHAYGNAKDIGAPRLLWPNFFECVNSLTPFTRTAGLTLFESPISGA
jgi:hypothetical protein